MPTLHAEPTPNPNSLKLTSDHGPFIDSGMVSLSADDAPAAHPLGRLLIAIDGIVDVLILPQFVTVSKAPGTAWDDVLPQVKQILSNHLSKTEP